MPQREWTAWMRELGSSIRRARELTGMTQVELAALAGVSQGALSRLERARGVSAPLVSVLRILAALQADLRSLPPDAIPADVRRLLDLPLLGEPGHDAPAQETPLGRLLEAYRGLQPAERAQFVRVATATAEAIAAGRVARHARPQS